MKMIKMAKTMTVFLIIMTAMSFVAASSALALHRVPSASPSGPDEPSGTIPVGYNNGAVQQAQDAAKNAVSAPSASKIDAVVADAGTNTDAAEKTAVGANALAVPLATTSASFKSSFLNSPISDAFHKENSLSANPMVGEVRASDGLLKKNMAANPNAVPMVSIPSMDSKEKFAAQEMALKPVPDSSSPLKDVVKVTEALKTIMSDLKKSDAAGDGPQVKELQDQFAKIADMMNSDQYSLNIPGRDAGYASVAHLFKGLDNQRAIMMMKYVKATEPYYDKVRNILVKNIKVIKATGGVAKQVTEEDIEKMSRSEIDKILEKMRQAADKTFEMDYILQQESKYKKELIEPNLKKFTGDMVEAIGSFTAKISEVIK